MDKKFLLQVALLVFIISFCASFTHFSLSTVQDQDKTASHSVFSHLKKQLFPPPPPTLTPFPTLTPTSTPTPTFIPTPTFSGFCQKIPVLIYHHIKNQEEVIEGPTVSTSWLESHLAFLASSGYKSISQAELINRLTKKIPSSGEKLIVLTFDDGYEDFYRNAYPLAKKYNAHFNLAVITGLVENQGYLTWAEIEEMVKSGLISFSNHTWSHNSLVASDNDKIKSEIETAQNQLSEHVEIKPQVITYPYGGFDFRILDIVKSLGLSAGFSTIEGHIQCDSFLMTLHRTRVENAPLSTYGL